MEILARPATEKGAPERFTGDVWLDTIARGSEPSREQIADADYLATPKPAR